MSSTDDTPALDPVVQGRSRRERPAKPPLSRSAVVEAALAILQRKGLEAVTMRAVAAALDTGAASLYVYVPNREGLLAAMLDHVTGEIELETPDPARWREQIHGLLGRLHTALEAHPGMAALTFADPPDSEIVLSVAENLLGILIAGGIAIQDAAWACDIFTLLVAAIANENDLRRARAGGATVDRVEDAADIAQLFAGLSTDRFPLLRGNAQAMISGDGAERFRWAVDILLDGMVARAARDNG